MDVSDEDLTDVVAKVFDTDGNELGSFNLLTESLIVDGIEVSFSTYDSILVATGTIA